MNVKGLFGMFGMIVVLLLIFVSLVFSAPKDGVSIQDGILKYQPGHYLAGHLFQTGYDMFGYNYQAHMYSGNYANAYFGGAGLPPYEGDDAAYLAKYGQAVYDKAKKHWTWPYRQDMVDMKWNDAWLANTDRDGDGKLDRHYGFASYVGSGAWETNHQSGTYTDNGQEYSWNYFVKIIAVPKTATKVAGVWYEVSGVEIGPNIWGEFAIIQEVSNDPGANIHGVQYRSPAGPGVGKW